MTSSRRQFLRTIQRTMTAAGTMAGLGHMTRFAVNGQSPGYRALVCIFLYGGNDSTNTFLPASGPAYSSYLNSRGPLALQQAELAPVSASGGQAFAFHGQAAGLADLYNRRKLAAVVNVGTLVRPVTKDEFRRSAAPVPRNLFSHSDQQLQWQNVSFGDGFQTGWGGRALQRLTSFNEGARIPAALSVAGTELFGIGPGGSMPATMDPGTEPGLWGNSSSYGSPERIRALKDILALESGAALVNAASGIAAEGLRQADVLKAVLAGRPPLQTAFPATDIGGQLKQIAEIIRVRGQLGIDRQMFFCSLGGFDTHIGQRETHGRFIGELSAAVKAFYDATVELGVEQRVTAFTHSEFGRTLQPSSMLGTDHAWGGHHFVIGGAVQGGQIYGQYPSLELNGPDDATGRGVMIPTRSVDQYAATLAAWMGVPQAQIVAMLPNLANFPLKNFGFLS